MISLCKRTAFALILFALSACTHVAPYEREHLAHPTMDVHEREQMRLRIYTHVYEAREGAMPATDRAGGGCGCN
jgi:hypothetical protein